MLAAIIALALLNGALLTALFLRERDHQNTQARADERHHAQLADLANRAAHPQVYQPVPWPKTEEQRQEPPELDGFELAGRAADEMMGDFARLVLDEAHGE